MAPGNSYLPVQCNQAHMQPKRTSHFLMTLLITLMVRPSAAGTSSSGLPCRTATHHAQHITPKVLQTDMVTRTAQAIEG